MKRRAFGWRHRLLRWQSAKVYHVTVQVGQVVEKVIEPEHIA